MSYEGEDELILGVAGMHKPFRKERHEHNVVGNTSVREIFGKRYMCRYNDLLTRHPDDLKTFGVRLSGDPVIDKQQRNADITTWTTIATMAHYLRIGVDIRVVNYSDTKAIYESVAKHIRAWREYYTFSLNQNVVPIEDLQALEDLSIKVFPAARSVMLKEGVVKDIFAKALSKFDLTSENDLFIRDDFNKKYNIKSNGISGAPVKMEIIREDNTDYIVQQLSKIGGIDGI